MQIKAKYIKLNYRDKFTRYELGAGFYTGFTILYDGKEHGITVKTEDRFFYTPGIKAIIKEFNKLSTDTIDKTNLYIHFNKIAQSIRK